MTEQPIKVGDIVRLSFGFADQSGSGEYEIIRVMPTREDGERQYRIRGADGFERAIGHGQLIGTSPKSSSPPG
ncbi:hypothetical protein [Bosea lathyri]|uniref:Uncharacterized protein n=1 Tax=Bosea lathyri TaxID=1036778 RepID=A0A1H6D5Y2_9HYPH|nr:hypothetical protein [Bosea lathyri]SEG80797.1 hypothetical protein SAMN04488115_11710 [Bosea lathyri]